MNLSRIGEAFFSLLQENPHQYLTYSFIIVFSIILIFLSDFITRAIILKIIKKLISKTATQWDDILYEKKVFQKLAHIIPALLAYLILQNFNFFFSDFMLKLIMSTIILLLIFAINAALDAVSDIYKTFKISNQRPIKGYIQLIKILIYILGVIFVISTLIDKSPWILISSIGAMTAIVLLVFKDTILGLVSSVQLSANNMLRIGDWIEFSKYNADGDVIDITLNSVKIQNWDKTITAIPTYAFISDSFKNWRAMNEAGGRRIKRSIYIDMTSIQFCDQALLEKFKQIRLLKAYLDKKEQEISGICQAQSIKADDYLNRRRLTNIGTFRAYLKAYLQSNPMLNQDMTFLVRHLAPTEHGLPIEIYVFSKDTAWANYENIQADIFDHILAVIPYFRLRIFQIPSGNDFKNFNQARSHLIDQDMF